MSKTLSKNDIEEKIGCMDIQVFRDPRWHSPLRDGLLHCTALVKPSSDVQVFMVNTLTDFIILFHCSKNT